MWESFVFLVINLTLVTSWIVYFSVATILYLIIYLFLRNNGVIIGIHIFNQIIKFQGYRCKSGITIFERSWSLEITLTVLWKFRHLNKFRWMFLFFSNGTEPLYPWFREPSNQGEEWKKKYYFCWWFLFAWHGNFMVLVTYTYKRYYCFWYNLKFYYFYSQLYLFCI